MLTITDDDGLVASASLSIVVQDLPKAEVDARQHLAGPAGAPRHR
ncbi:MAG: hypothetical protein ACOX46_03570 [Limnochordia bacterium]